MTVNLVGNESNPAQEFLEHDWFREIVFQLLENRPKSRDWISQATYATYEWGESDPAQRIQNDPVLLWQIPQKQMLDFLTVNGFDRWRIAYPTYISNNSLDLFTINEIVSKYLPTPVDDDIVTMLSSMVYTFSVPVNQPTFNRGVFQDPKFLPGFSNSLTYFSTRMSFPGKYQMNEPTRCQLQKVFCIDNLEITDMRWELAELKHTSSNKGFLDYMAYFIATSLNGNNGWDRERLLSHLYNSSLMTTNSLNNVIKRYRNSLEGLLIDEMINAFLRRPQYTSQIQAIKEGARYWLDQLK